MENGEEVLGEARIGERNGVVDEIVEVQPEDKAAVGLHVSKESEGDDVFEEAIEPETPGVGVEDGVLNCSLEDNGNSESRDDAENFEEAVEALHEIQHADDESNQKADNNSTQEPSVEKQNYQEIAATDETEVVEQNIIVEKGKDDIAEVADLGAAVETETSANRDERKDKSGEPAEFEEGVSNHVNLGETQSHDDAKETNSDLQDQEVHGKLDTQDVNEAKGGNNVLQNQVLSYKDALLHEEKNVDVIETSAVQRAGHQDTDEVQNNVTVSSGSVLKDDRYTDVKDEEQKNISPNDASTNGHLGESLNPSDELKGEAGPSPERMNGYNMNEEQIDVEKTMPSPEPVNGSNKDEEQQIDGVKAVDSPEPVNGSNKDEEQLKDGVKAVCSPEPIKGSNKDEEQQIDEVKAVHSTVPVNASNKDEEQQLDGEKAVCSPEPVNSSNRDEQQIDGPGDDAVSTLQGGTSPLKTEVPEKESTGPEPIAPGYMVEQKDILSGDATDHQGLKSNESPTVGPGNLYDRTNEQKNVSVSGTSASENHTETTADDEISKSSEVLPYDNHEKVSKVSQDAGVGVDKVVMKESVKSVVVEDLKQSVPRVTQPEAKSATEYPSSSSASATRVSAPVRPAGLGRAAPLLEPAPRVVQQPRVNGTASPAQNQIVEESTNGEADEYDETREKLQMIRVKFLRLAHRNGQTPHNVVVAQVLYRLGLAEQLRGRSGGRVGAFSFDRASAMAEQLEAAGQEPLDFSCTIMVLGKTGVGKSATINSIFDEVKFGTDAFQIGTKKVQDVVGTVQGIKVRVIDTPGLLPSWSDQRQNEKILHSVKRFIKKTPPDIVLYLDRLDMQSRDNGDMPLLRTITDIFGPSIWFNAIVVLTHAASAPPEGPNGTVTSYDMFVTQRSHVVQQAIRQAAGDMRLMNPVSLVENHSACRTNRAGQRVLPNGQVWRPHLLLLSFASKILAEANTLLKLQDSSPPGQPYAARTRSPPLPFLLSSLLQSRPQVKLPAEQFDDDDDALYDDLDESSESEDESEYDQLPPFKRLTKAQLSKLSKEQKKAYNDELEYREKLFMKKQLKEERKRRKMMKKMQAAAENLPPTDPSENADEETGGAASVPVPMPDLALPASFDSDNPTHRYRYLDSSNQWLVRPVLEPNGWDHDVGYEGINVERLFVVKDKIPISLSSQVSKDKKDTNLQMELASSVKHGNGKATSLGFDMQSVGKDLAYTLRSETRFCNYRKNKATAGLSVTLLGDVMTGGVKVEDKLTFNRRGSLVVSGGAMFGRGDVAYGGSLEATLRDKDYPLGRFLSTLGLSVMDWHGDLAIGCNSQTQIPIGRYTNLIGRVNINNKGSGQVSIRLNSSEQLQIALISLIPLVRKLISYSQPAQFG
ncbi:translocase of chloroplast 120, chloroplastic-like isoform X2 [Lycium ferocissimum]|uniref:translocase of chloroplast 120, chloroplastic-like isoform X2 n=1 Tax=Lycium ferocissimum TaxID=112874 RepID=UPI002815FF3B|nr:translocase of chloroplast 120, chloroplastic-like isoform X2 [Lycium ferocissimum]